jgi:hypothetical protein
MSGTIRIELGNPAPLQLQLPDGNATAAVKASVFDSNNVEIVGSPFVLTSAGNGRYSNITGFIPAAIGQYLASYVVYKDNGYNLILGRYSRAVDEFEVNTAQADTTTEITKENQIIVAIAALKSDTSLINRLIAKYLHTGGRMVP